MASSTEILMWALMIGGGISLVFLLAQAGMTSINPNGTDFYDCSKGLFSRYITGGCDTSSQTALTVDSLNNTLPTANSQVSATGSSFTDLFTSAKDWILNKVPGAGFIVDILALPKHILMIIGLPPLISTAIATLWWMIIMFALVSWLFQR